MAQQVKNVTSEALESAYRALTPSQDGFTEDLMASNVILPVLDLTADAGGASTPQYLQTALAFGSQTAFNIINTTTTIANVPGFYRVYGTSAVRGSGNQSATWLLSDGTTDKEIWALISDDHSFLEYDFTVFLNTGELIKGTTTTATAFLKGSIRQVADVNGTLVNPSGFTPQ